MMKWRDVPVGGEGHWGGTRYRRVTGELVVLEYGGRDSGKDHVEVEYLEECGPADERIKPGTLGLIAADDDADDRVVPF